MTSNRTPDAESTALRALRVLEAVGRPGGPHQLGQLARETGLAKPTVHRILRSLTGAGYVTSDGSGSYGPGSRAYALSALFAGTGRNDSDAILRRIQSEVDQTVHVALLSGRRAIYVQKVENDKPYRMASRIGGQLRLHSTAIGKVILAHSTPEDQQAVIAEGLTPQTSETITDATAFAAELDRVRAQGYALDDEENEETIRCLAAPLLDQSGLAFGGISISTITFQTPRDELLQHTSRLIETAALLAPAYR